MDGKEGFVLGFVLVLIMSLTILFGCLLCIPGGLSRQASRYEKSVQAVYDAESAIIASLSGFPDGYIEGLPYVTRDDDGLWGRVCASAPKERGLLCAEYGTRYTRRRFDEWFAALAAYRTGLRERILSMPKPRTVSGNRRFFRLDSSVALHVSGGDLLLDMDSRVPSGAFVVEGSVNVKGRARFDTLRIFADGDVRLGGEVVAARLEVYSGGSIEVYSRFRFSGMLAARREILLRDRVRADFPSVAVAIGSGDCSVTLAGHAAFAGVLAAPGGNVAVDTPDSLAGAAFPGTVSDSAFALLPAFFDGESVPFRRSAQQ